MFERYTEKARRAIFIAHFEAIQFGSANIETEHILLGLLHEDYTAAKRLLGPEISQQSIRDGIKSHTISQERTLDNGHLPFSNECQQLMANAVEDADRLGNKHIGTEHLLLGLLREVDCSAAQMLQGQGVELDRIRKEITASSPPINSGQSDGHPLSASARPMDEAETTWVGERRKQPRKPLQQYSEKARRALFFARFEASQFGTSQVNTEHLLLGLLREGKAHLDLFVEPDSALESIRRQIKLHSQHGSAISMSVDLPLTDELRRALQYGAEEAQRLQSDLIGPEHLLMGILREEQSFAAQMLLERGADLEEIRKNLAQKSPVA